MTRTVSALLCVGCYVGPTPEFGLTGLHIGTWIASEEAVVPLLSLYTLEKQLYGEEKQLFIRFMRSMLKWLPEERSTAKQLLEDPWLL